MVRLCIKTSKASVGKYGHKYSVVASIVLIRGLTLMSLQLYAEDDDMPFFAVSAKDGSAVQESFLTLVSEVMKARNSQQQYSYSYKVG